VRTNIWLNGIEENISGKEISLPEAKFKHHVLLARLVHRKLGECERNKLQHVGLRNRPITDSAMEAKIMKVLILIAGVLFLASCSPYVNIEQDVEVLGGFMDPKPGLDEYKVETRIYIKKKVWSQRRTLVILYEDIVTCDQIPEVKASQMKKALEAKVVLEKRLKECKGL
jgi:hypothetical protein